MGPLEETPIWRRLFLSHGHLKSASFAALANQSYSFASELWLQLFVLCVFDHGKTTETLKHHHVLCTAWDFPPYVSLTLTQWHSRCWECAFVVEITMWKKRAVLHLCFVVVLFCFHVGLFAPSSAYTILDPHKKKKNLLSHLFLLSFYIYPLKASFLRFSWK